MTNYINYSTANISGFAQGYDYGGTIMNQGTGLGTDMFSLLILFGIFMVFTGISMKFNQERAFLYGLFVTCVATSLLISGQLLNPLWAAIPFSLFLIALFVWGAKS
jgi:hypothetical protein